MKLSYTPNFRMISKHGFIQQFTAISLAFLLSLMVHGCDNRKFNDINLDGESILSSPVENSRLQAHAPKNDSTNESPDYEVYRCSKDSLYNINKEQKVSLDLFETDLREALVELSIQIGYPILIDESVNSLISATLDDVALVSALEILLVASNYSYLFDKNYILVGASETDTASFEKLSKTCRYKPRYISSEALFETLSDQQQQYVNIPEGSEFLSIHAPSMIQDQILSSLELHDEELKQVILELSIIEVSREAMQVLGISWDRPMSVTYDILKRPILLRSMRALQKQGKAFIKTMPSIVSKDGHQAHFESKYTTWLPYPTKNDFSSLQRQQISYGIELKVTTNIATDGRVNLEILNARVSDLIITKNNEHVLISHQISNTVDVQDGDYLVLGGLIQKKKTSSEEGLPFFSKFNPMRLIFAEHQTNEDETEILIMIRPRII